MEELELLAESLRQEKLTLNSELLSAKEKLHSCEALVQNLTNPFETYCSKARPFY